MDQHLGFLQARFTVDHRKCHHLVGAAPILVDLAVLDRGPCASTTSDGTGAMSN